MKIVDLATFLTLPSFTIYCELTAEDVDLNLPHVMVRHPNPHITDSFLTVPLIDIDADDFESRCNLIEEAALKGASIPMCTNASSRSEGDKDARYFVFEAADVKMLAKLFNTLDHHYEKSEQERERISENYARQLNKMA